MLQIKDKNGHMLLLDISEKAFTAEAQRAQRRTFFYSIIQH